MNQHTTYHELLDSGCSVIASNDDGAADGRNARISFTPVAAATYTVRVRPAAGSAAGVYVVALTTNTSSTLPGDLNDDRRVNLIDLAILQGNFGRADATAGDGDLDADGDVDRRDLALFSGSYSRSEPSPSPQTADALRLTSRRRVAAVEVDSPAAVEPVFALRTRLRSAAES
jgi:hypothetical protein